MKENRYYVYLHKIASTGEVFYVGKGCGNRLLCSSKRNKIWNEITSKNKWVAEKHTEYLTEEHAANLEVTLIAQIAPIANVRKKDTSAKPLKKEQFDGIYYYCENSKSGLRFAKDITSNFSRSSHKAGDDAGTMLPSGYYGVQLEGKTYLAHRVVWALFYGSLGRCIIDHKDKNRSNNKITNLRVVDYNVNSKNLSVNKNNKTGFTGVEFIENRNSYSANWTNDAGKRESKYFSVEKYGRDVALGLAAEYRHRKELEIETYTPNQNYQRHEALLNYSNEDIEAVFESGLIANNTSGVENVFFSSPSGGSFWTYKNRLLGCKSFSCKKYGNNLAKSLAIEYKTFIENNTSIDALSETLREEIQNPNNVNNVSGIRGISFTGINKDIITARFGGLMKTFKIKEHGLLPSIKMAMEWRDNVKKE